MEWIRIWKRQERSESEGRQSRCFYSGAQFLRDYPVERFLNANRDGQKSFSTVSGTSATHPSPPLPPWHALQFSVPNLYRSIAIHRVFDFLANNTATVPAASSTYHLQSRDVCIAPHVRLSTPIGHVPPTFCSTGVVPTNRTTLSNFVGCNSGIYNVYQSGTDPLSEEDGEKGFPIIFSLSLLWIEGKCYLKICVTVEWKWAKWKREK